MLGECRKVPAFVRIVVQIVFFPTPYRGGKREGTHLMKRPSKKTKIVATLGPASWSPRMVGSLLSKGADVFRVNFSHGSVEEHEQTLRAVEQVRSQSGASCGILADLQGPKIRTGRTQGDRSIALRTGGRVRLVPKAPVCTEKVISIDYSRLAHDIKPGHHVMLNDGAVRLRVLSVDQDHNEVLCVVESSGEYSSRKGVNLPDTSLKLPSLTRKDREDLTFILSHDFQYVALSFVRSADDVRALRRVIRRSGKTIRVVAKIEKPEAAENIDEILEVCDGIMVARGDLGVETSPERIPLLQKDLITRANERGAIVIVATQMLDSMIHRALPSRAESTDVANAILDGADAIMLSGETAVGAYPAKAVEMMSRITRITEQSRYYPSSPVDLTLRPSYPPHSVCEAAATASRDLGHKPVVVFTLSGETALYLAKVRNQSPIYAFSPDPNVVSMLSLAWNITALYLPLTNDIVSLQQRAEDALVNRRLVRKGEVIVIISGTTPVHGATNSLRVKKVGDA